MVAGGWLGGSSYTGAFKQSKIKYHGSGGSSYTATVNSSFSASGKTVKIISASQTTGGGSPYNTTASEDNRPGLPGSAVITYAGK